MIKIGRNVSMFTKLLYFFSIMLVLVIITGVIIYGYSSQALIEETKNTSRGYLTSISERIDDMILQFNQMSFIIAKTESFEDMISVSTDKDDVLKMYITISDTMDLIGTIKGSNNKINEVYVCLEKPRVIISSEGKHQYDKFFREHTYYKDVRDKKSADLQNKDDSYFIILEKVKRNENNVIPVVFFLSKFIDSDVLLIIEINEKYFIDILNSFKISDEQVNFISNKNADIISHSGKIDNNEDFSLEKDIVIESNKQEEDIVKISNSRYFIYNIYSDYIKWSYYTAVPMSVIDSKTTYIKKMTIIICLIIIAFGVLMAFIFSKIIYKPIGETIDMLIKKGLSGLNIKRKTDEINIIKNKIDSMYSSNEELKSTISAFIPYTKEGLFKKLLVDHESIENEEIINIMKQVGFQIDGKLYVTAIIRIHFIKEFEKDNQNSGHVKNEIIKYICNSINEEYPAVIINWENEDTVIIMEVNVEKDLDIVSHKVETINKILGKNEERIELHTGIGNIIDNLNNLNMSLSQAVNSLESIIPGKGNITVVNCQKNDENNWYFPLDYQRMIVSYTIGCDNTRLIKVITEVVMENSNIGFSYRNHRKINEKFVELLLRVVKRKGLSTDNTFNFYKKSITNNYMSSDKKVAFMCKVFNYMTEIISENSKHKSINIRDDVIAYVNNNYHEDIYIGKIADHFSMSAAYLSRLFKEEIGINFHDYLSNVRIAESKKLLLNTETNVNEIASRAGFNSRNTFFRMFKKHEGISPSKFREVYKTNT